MTNFASPSRDHVVGFIDIGTNSIRLLLEKIEPNGAKTTLSVQKETVRLGEAEFEDGYLQMKAMRRATMVAKEFAEMARANNVDQLITVATSATREAKNKRDFLRMLKKEANLDVRVISGIEEARLIYLGVSHGVHLDGKTALMIDIGGGSTELIIGNQEQYFYLDSLKLGAIRLYSDFFSEEDTGPVSQEDYEKICEHVHNSAIRSLQKLKDFPFDIVYGSSGTIENLGDIVIERLYKRSRVREDVITYGQLDETIKYLCSLDIEQRRLVPGINPLRADIIIPGAAIIQTLMRLLSFDELNITDQGVRNGLLVDHLTRTEHAEKIKTESVRDHSVLQLARKCNFDEAHGFQVSKLSLALFDSAKEIGLISLDDRYREILHFSALLHDIGIFLSYSNHQSHSYYLVKNADLLGFDQEETSTMAALAFYHRKKIPRTGHKIMQNLMDEDQDAVIDLAPILRIAETLDRSHQAIVADAKLVIRNGKVVLHVYPLADSQMEIWGLKKHGLIFEETYQHPLMVDVMDIKKDD